MSVFPSWPWTNFHEENLDWVIKKVKYIEEHIEEIVVDATSDMLDDTLTNPDKASQAKVTGDGIRANAADIASLDTTVQGITNNVTNLTTRVTRNEGTINNLLAADDDLDDRLTELNNSYQGTRTDVTNLTTRVTSNENSINNLRTDVTNLTTRVTRNEGTINELLAADDDLDDRITDLNNMYQGTRTDVINLTSRVSHTETQISNLGGVDEALSDRITALEGTVNAVKDYVFNIYLYTGYNDPTYVCTMDNSPNNINSLLTDLNGRIPVNVKAIINYGGVVSSRVANLTTVRVGGEIHGVEFDAGDFHCRFLDSNTMGSAYFNKILIRVDRTQGTATLVKGDCMSLSQYTPQISITDTNSGGSYIPTFIDRSHEQSYIKLWYLGSVDDVQHMESLFVQVNVDNTVQLT